MKLKEIYRLAIEQGIKHDPGVRKSERAAAKDKRKIRGIKRRGESGF